MLQVGVRLVFSAFFFFSQPRLQYCKYCISVSHPPRKITHRIQLCNQILAVINIYRNGHFWTYVSKHSKKCSTPDSVFQDCANRCNFFYFQLFHIAVRFIVSGKINAAKCTNHFSGYHIRNIEYTKHELARSNICS